MIDHCRVCEIKLSKHQADAIYHCKKCEEQLLREKNLEEFTGIDIKTMKIKEDE